MTRTLSFRELRIHIRDTAPKDVEEQSLIGTGNSAQRKMPNEPGFSFH